MVVSSVEKSNARIDEIFETHENWNIQNVCEYTVSLYDCSSSLTADKFFS